MIGAEEGIKDGKAVGTKESVGSVDGICVGSAVGMEEGALNVGKEDGDLERVGRDEGADVDWITGEKDGRNDGITVGDEEGDRDCVGG